MSLFESLPPDVFTEFIFIPLSTLERYAVLGAFPNLSLKVKWDILYQKKLEPQFDPAIVAIYEKHFELWNTRKHRLRAMEEYYIKTDIDIGSDDDEFYEEDLDLRDVPIVDNNYYKLEDYINSIEDYIYDEMRQLKKERQSKSAAPHIY